MVVKLDSGFEILRFSDLKFEEITVEIKYLGESIAQINKDKGDGLFEIEIFTEFAQTSFIPRFIVDDFITALVTAKELLQG